MKRILFALMLFTTCAIIPTSAQIVNDNIYTIADVMPSFKGNVCAWLANHVQYPSVAAANGVQGKVIVRFVIDKNGYAKDASIVRSLDPALDREALRLINSMPQWNPGYNAGNPVDVWFTLPITFHLDDDAHCLSSNQTNNAYLNDYQNRINEYRKLHKWWQVPVGYSDLACTDCDEVFNKDSIKALGIKNDSIYFIIYREGDLGLDGYNAIHVAKISQSLKESNDFMLHYNAFKDSLVRTDVDYGTILCNTNSANTSKYFNKLRKKAPYGFIKDWGWNNSYGFASMNLTYENLNPKTIRYIAIYFKITNDVGDVRCIGHFTGTGPVGQYSSVEWNWDNVQYPISDDATNMQITKIIITWMNKAKTTLIGKYIQDETEYE